jgi:uncharacterized protein
MSELFDAVTAGDAALVQRLLEAGADVNAFDGEGRTPLMVAAQLGDDEQVLLLLDAGADPTIAAPDGETAYLKAAAHGQAQLAGRLERFASPDERALAGSFLKAHAAQVADEAGLGALGKAPPEPAGEEAPSELRQTLVKAAARAAKAVGHESPAARVERQERAERLKKKR